MNIEEFREYCLSFKGVHEKMPFPNVPDQYSRDVLYSFHFFMFGYLCKNS